MFGSPRVAVVTQIDLEALQIDLDWPLRCADARPDHLPLLPVNLAATQIPHVSRAECPDAGVTDTLAAAERELEAGVLPRYEDRLGAVGLRLTLGGQELDRAPLPLTVASQSELRLEALDVQPLADVLAVPVFTERVEHLGRSRDEGFALPPVAA